MFICKIENSKNEILRLTQNESKYQIISITGLTPVDIQINTTDLVGIDGSKFKSSKVQMRNIVLQIKINGDVEKNRINLYNFFELKNKLKLYYKNQTRDVYIECYRENIECDLFTNNEMMQVSLLAPNPYFKALDYMLYDVSKITAMFEFPFAIDYDKPIEFSTYEAEKTTNVFNYSEIEVGMLISIDVLHNFRKIEFKNISSGEFFLLESDFLEGDRIEINTNKGEKSIILIRNARKINLFSALKKRSTFFQLKLGDNLFSYLVDDGTNELAIEILFKVNRLFEGV